MMDEEIRQALSEVQEMKKMCGNINMKLTNIVTQRGQDWKAKLEAEYQRGLEDGKKATFELVADALNADYQRGFEDGKAQPGHSCEGCIYQDKTIEHHLCDKCCNAYNNMWTAKQTDDEIKVGDEVEWDDDFTGDRFIVTRIYQPYGKKEQCDGIDDDGDVYRAVLIESLVKTGRHFGIASILKEMQS